MGELKNYLKDQVKEVSKIFLEKAENKEINLISHFDTDGISSLAIMIKAIKRLDKKFSVKIIKGLDEQTIRDLPKDKLNLFLDLGSGSLNYLKDSGLSEVFIIDHHEIIQEIPHNVEIINSQLHDKQKISTSGLTYLFCKEIDKKNKDLAKLAVLGMVGDMLEKEIGKLNNGILEDGEIKRKKGILIYPSTRPLSITLEYSSNPYIPGVTGNAEGVMELLREINISVKGEKAKSIIDLNEEEMQKLTTAIMLRNPKCKSENIVGDIFLIKMYNKLEDARELSAMVNACSRYGEPSIALQLLMEIPKAKKKAEAIHIKYKQQLLSSLKFIEKVPKIVGRGFVVINAKNEVKDTMIGTVASIIQNSNTYEEGTIIITMAYYEDKIKVSSRSVGKNGRNVREMLQTIVTKIGGEVGGHEFAAGCNIYQEKEKEFIDLLKKSFEIELVKV